MIVYMLRRISTGLYFRKSIAQHLDWVQKGGEVWTDKRGPNSAKAKCKRLGATDVEVVPFVMTEAKDTHITMKQGSITIVRGDDWEGIYINGRLVRENHSFDSDDVLSILGIDYQFKEADCKWLDKRGRLPEKLEDVVCSG